MDMFNHIGVTIRAMEDEPERNYIQLYKVVMDEKTILDRKRGPGTSFSTSVW
jgi:hypothetical protein